MQVSDLILHLVKYESAADDLFDGLHGIAKLYDQEMGLPNSSPERAQMRCLLLEWLANYTDRVDVYGPTRFKDADLNGYGDAAEEAIIKRLEQLAHPAIDTNDRNDATEKEVFRRVEQILDYFSDVTGSDPTDTDPRDLDGEMPF